MPAQQPVYVSANMICGMPGTGKTTLAKNLIENRPKSQPNALVYVEEENIKERSYLPIPLCSPLSKYAGGAAQINAGDISIESLLWKICRSYRDGILVIDEAGLYELAYTNPHNKKVEPIPPLKLILKHRRKYNITLYLLYHGLSEIPVQLIKYMNNFVLFHQTDEFAYKKGVIPRVAELEAMQRRVGDKYFSGEKDCKYYHERLKLG